MNWQKLQDDIAEFADKVFPNSTARSKALHLKEEAQEIADQPDDITEFGDAQILLLDAARKMGFSVEDIFNAASTKLEVNKKRVWNKPDANGVVGHKQMNVQMELKLDKE